MLKLKKIALQLSACIVAGIACCGTALAQTYQGRVYYLNSSDDRPCYFAHVVYTVKDGVALPQAVGRWFALKRSSVNYAERSGPVV